MSNDRLRLNQAYPEEYFTEREIRPGLQLDIVIGSRSIDQPKNTFKTQSPYVLPYYWRLDDPAYNLVEIEIDPDFGKLKSIAIPLYNGRIVPWEVAPREAEGEIIGLPGFELSLWSSNSDYEDRFYDVPGRCIWMFKEEKLRIVLFQDQIKYQVFLPDGKLTCEFNRFSELCAITLIGLDVVEQAILSERT